MKINTWEKRSGKLIVFEGSDGVGKTTIVKHVVGRIKEEGGEAIELSFPGRTKGTLGELVYKVHHEPDRYIPEGLSPLSLQALHVSAHVDYIERTILPALSDGKTVVLDRFWWSTVAYGLAQGVSKELLTSLIAFENHVWGSVRPDVLFLITRDKPLRVELGNRKWSLVCKNYQDLLEQEKSKYKIVTINNSNTIKDATRQALKVLRDNKKSKQMRLNISRIGDIPSTSLSRTDKFPLVLTRWSPSKTTVVFDTYWKFATERQSIFFKRLSGKPYPWTEDKVLRDHKFTNVFRASDRVSQYLIREVIYGGRYSNTDVFFRILLFKMFNKTETWELLNSIAGEISWETFNYKYYAQTLSNAMERGQRIYSAAYIMPSRGRGLYYDKKHKNHLKLIEMMMKGDLHHKIVDSKSMEEVFSLLRSYPMIGDFLAYQLATDINYSELTDFDEMSFVVPGPGAKDGLRKCFTDFGGLTEVDLIRMMADRQEEEFDRLGLNFRNLWGRKLQLIDCQNLLCEVDKYSRIVHPEFLGLSKRSRIKQKFKPINKPIDYYFPPKWGLNDKCSI